MTHAVVRGNLSNKFRTSRNSCREYDGLKHVHEKQGGDGRKIEAHVVRIEPILADFSRDHDWCRDQ